jgi:hypothetical protein
MSPGASHPDPLRYVRIDLYRPDPDPAPKNNVSDPEAIRSVDPDSESGSGSRRAKMTYKIEKKFRNLIFELLNVLF